MTRKVIENMTGAYMSVYGRTVSLVGGFEEVADAKRAVDMLIHGSMHSTVYKFLENLKRQKKVEEKLGIWKEGEEEELEESELEEEELEEEEGEKDIE